jgi:dUTP pyrophosphatase
MNSIEIPTITEDPVNIPMYSTLEASGADVRAYISQPIVLEPGCSALIPTGLRFAIPSGYEIQVRPRSGLALKHQITVLNAPGTIDADYRGELGIILINHGKEPFTVQPGMRIAQIVVAATLQANFVASGHLTETLRGEGGFGHTGVN